MSAKTVFISYRRDRVGKPFSRSLKIVLEHHGYDVFLDEAWEIAQRGPMPLFMADIHLYRARLFFRETAYPWDSPKADLACARRLMEKHGYWRRKEELEDAKAAILQKPGGGSR